ncbi:hypothetical protein GJW-30_1_01102 [Variibacter gotjawalensis]|uniref:Uncharacterized protein n=1 Tax=Variibacter gotjawalensis TaxID=1333996 RepID=A0A0S3PRU8_9BRAD|nr:hypothetical protein [Variibacter gotjawalensis]NIK48885.1 hypothetical protein [Variibacter gotjawalensis]RZS50741.1 hypothetical protein EV661_3211 [Variibacter gotjawalensis]BAT58576.1 hypothetical protein GJW-30_1_01102 [Variibacter gotjawalensis]
MSDETDHMTAEKAATEANFCDAQAEIIDDVPEVAAIWRDLAERWRKLATRLGASIDGQANF